VASHANPGSQGDALELGQQAGADLTGENRGLFVVRPRFRQYGESKRFIYVNERGRRFINEAAYYSTVAHAIRRQGGRALMVFDDRTRVFFEGDYDRSAPFRAEDLGLDWIGTTPLARRTARIVSAPTLRELGSAAGLDPAVVEGTVASYNSGCEAGEDAAFFKEPQHLHPIDQAPYYAVEVRPAAVVLTGYGMRIDTQGRVVRPTGEVIPSLYAAGEAVGNYYGEVYVASGSSLTGGIVFGTRAGADTAAVARTLQPA
jgi:succinate dehydrogenase/fumarate reductase flavoprotein subunit